MGNKQVAHQKNTGAPLASNPPEYDYLFKILIVGDTNCGRRTLRQAIIDKCCKPINLGSDRNADHIDGDFSLPYGKIARIQLWKRKNTVDENNSYFRGAHAFLICYNITDYETFENAFKWRQEIHRYSRFDDDATTFIVATQSDLASERQVALDQATDRCQNPKIPFFEVSGITGEGVVEMFNTFIGALLKYYQAEV
eukprot:TRINITY_DN1307_c0_g1_i2.p1 TRINITY_DN1307_c0_g1~~TRINITY_DN1307_c0_g1_i2.p1  ORF type:complete len:197 (+),score=15.03 TRINITY_DN1307_c0_g1_i2:353-943(+)